MYREVWELRTWIRHLEEILEPCRGPKVPNNLQLSETFPKTIERIVTYHEQIDQDGQEYLDTMIDSVNKK